MAIQAVGCIFFSERLSINQTPQKLSAQWKEFPERGWACNHLTAFTVATPLLRASHRLWCAVALLQLSVRRPSALVRLVSAQQVRSRHRHPPRPVRGVHGLTQALGSCMPGTHLACSSYLENSSNKQDLFTGALTDTQDVVWHINTQMKLWIVYLSGLCHVYVCCFFFKDASCCSLLFNLQMSKKKKPSLLLHTFFVIN